MKDHRSTRSNVSNNPQPDNPDNNFRYDASLGSTGGYIFNLATKGLQPGAYQVRFRVGSDPSLYSVSVQLR